VADKSHRLIIEALQRAAHSPAGLPLHGTRNVPGLFPITGPGKLAAQRCWDEGFLAPASGDASSEAREPGRTPTPSPVASAASARCVLTPKGLNWLLQQTSSRQVLEDLLRALEARETQLTHLLDCARQMQSSLAGLRARVEQVLDSSDQPGSSPPSASTPLQAMCREFHGGAAEEPVEPIVSALSQLLERWRASGSPDDQPLPGLYRQLAQSHPGLTIGRFHDALRQAHEQGRIYLHPWTGPLHELPEPALALLSGHLVAYYASPHQSVVSSQ
jgi:hypothetical protein